MKNQKKYNDRKFINEDTYQLYANTNEDFLTLPVRGIVVEFPGLGGGSCLGGQMDRKPYGNFRVKDFAGKGIVVAYLFPGPWSWGNRGAVRMADAVIDAIAGKYGLEGDFPLVACGGSMGGVGSLMFAAYSRHKISQVVAACPCVDVPECFGCHDDFPRTYISAVACYDMELDEALRSISPIHCIDKMPKTEYFICCDDDDEIFPKEQCDLYVEKLKQAGYSVEYHTQPGLVHGEFLPDVREMVHSRIEKAILG